MGLFQLGDFTLNSGAQSRWKIECDALTDEDIKCLATLIATMTGPFRSVVGVPTGGLRLAKALIPYESLGSTHPDLIVDDVLTTGGSMEKMRNTFTDTGNVKGAVIFARGQLPFWVKAVFTMDGCFWIKPRVRG